MEGFVLEELIKNNVAIRKFTEVDNSELFKLYREDYLNHILSTACNIQTITCNNEIIGIIGIRENHIVCSSPSLQILSKYINYLKAEGFTYVLTTYSNLNLREIGFKYKYSYKDSGVKRLYQLNISEHKEFACLKMYHKYPVIIEKRFLER